MKGELLDKVIGLHGAETEFVMLESPDGQLNIEVIKYLEPKDSEGIRVLPANTLGMRHIAFQVEEFDEMLRMLQEKGYELIGEVQQYENIWKLCYIRGPEGLIVELAEKLQDS